MKQSPKKPHILLTCVVLVLATFIAFEQVRRNEFVDYDDDKYVTENPRVKAGITHESVVWAFTTPHAANWHPLTWLSHMLDCELFGLNPLWHHLTSLLFHIINTLLLFGILKSMTGAVWRSAFVAAAFALHPLHVESVAWISERKDVLSGFFWMLTMAAYLRYVKHPGKVKYLLTLLVFVLGLMAKPMLVTLPFVLLLLDYWPLGRFQNGQALKDANRKNQKSVDTRSQWSVSYRLVLEKVPFLVFSAASCIVTFLVQQIGAAVTPIENLPLNTRMANALVSYIRYVGKMIYPSRLAVLYPYRGDSLPVWQPIVSVLTLAVISAGIIYTVRRRRYLTIGWFWYLGMLVPVIGLVQVGNQAMADRYTYLPSIGIFIIVAWGAAELLAKWRYRNIGLQVSAGLLLVAMLICTRVQVQHWQNDITLFEHTLRVTEKNYIAHSNLALGLNQRGRLEEAIKHFEESVRLRPGGPMMHNNLGAALLRQGKFDESITHFTKALEISPQLAEAHYNLGVALAQQGKLDEAVKRYEKSLQLKADQFLVHNDWAMVLFEQERFDEAIAHWTESLHLNPDQPEVHNDIGLSFARLGDLDEAVKHYNESIKLNPGHSYVYKNLGLAQAQQNKFDQAVTNYRKSLDLDPNQPGLLNSLGAALVHLEKVDEALESYTKSLQLKPNQPFVHKIIADIFFQRAKLNEAIFHYTKALCLKSELSDVHNSLAEVYFQQEKFEQAMVHWNEALKIKPDWVNVLNNIAWIKATNEEPNLYDPNEAVELAQRACELSDYKEPSLLDTLSVAYAAAGKFPEAIEAAEKAIELALASNQQQLADEIKNHLELYRRGQADHDSAESQKKHNP